MTPRKRILELRRLLDEANHAYYVEAEPIMPDLEFDQLLAELATLEEANPKFADPSSPTQRVGGAPSEGFRTARHAMPMLSIDNTYTTEDLLAWDQRVARGLGETHTEPRIYVCDPKIDGVAISLRYEEGLLHRAVTRGDGVRGDDVTAQVRTIRAIPLKLRSGSPHPKVLEVRGEIFIPNREFNRINRERESAGEPPFANARNATAGTLKSLDPAVAASRRLGFLAHGRGEVEGMPAVTTYWGFLEAIRGLGIPVSRRCVRREGIDAVIEVIESFKSQRGELDFGVDGMVVRLDELRLQEALGATSKAPRWCIAFKYPAEQGTTVLRSVDWQVGKGGTLTPRATMDPIFLAGTTVQHATLHNIEEIRRKDIRIDDRVVIEKAGEIIPQVVEVILSARPKKSRPIEPPQACPACGGGVNQEGPKLYCVNPECPAQFRERLKWFVGRNQMDIDGMGDKLIDQLVDGGLVGHFADLFMLQRQQLLDMERMAERSTDNLLAAIEVSKGRGLARVLAGLGIRHIGSTAARTLARHFKDARTLMDAGVEDIAALPDFGDITAAALHEYLQSPIGRETFRRLAEVGVDLASHETAPVATTSSPFRGKTVVLTGTLKSFTRQELTDQLEAVGAKVTGSVSTRTDLVIVGDSAGKKAERARELGIEVWDETRLKEELAVGE